jgi:hypothetical protein
LRRPEFFAFCSTRVSFPDLVNVFDFHVDIFSFQIQTKTNQHMGAINREDLSAFAFDDLGPVLTASESPVFKRKSLELLREVHFKPSQKIVVLNKVQLSDFNVLTLVGQGGYGKVKRRYSVIFP